MKLTKTQLILITILIIGLILRLIAVYHIDIEADELVISTRAINFISAQRLSTPDQEPLYHYLTDLGYKLLGVNTLSIRLFPLITSLLSILLIFYITKEFFNKKIALISAFFLSINHFFIRFMLEPDIVAGFFALFSTFLFIKWIKNKQSIFLYGSALALGLGLMNKPTIIMIIFAFGYLFLTALFKKEIKLNFGLVLKICFAILIVTLCLTPIFAYNYLLYKEKGVTDILFARFFDTNKEVYAGLSGINDGFSITSLSKSIKQQLASYWKYDPFIFSLTIAGFFLFLWRLLKNQKYSFLLLWIFAPFVFIAGSTSVPVHYTILTPFFCLLSANVFYFITKTIKSRFKVNLYYVLLGLVFMGTLFFLIPTLSEESSTIQLREFAEEIEGDDFILVDSRTYRGIIAYSFNDKHYLETNHWIGMQRDLERLAANSEPITTYIIECVSDKCGWGDVSGVNESNEMLFEVLRNLGPKIKTIKGEKYVYDIYKTTININPIILDIADQTHSFYYFPVRYENKEQIFDNYKTETLFDKIFNSFAYFMIYIETFLAILFIIGLGIYFYLKKS